MIHRIQSILCLVGFFAAALCTPLHGANPVATTAGSANHSSNRNTDSSVPAATTILPPMEVRYGWPEAASQGWNLLPPLADVRYAVVPLTGMNWPVGAVPIQLDDLGDVLARRTSSDDSWQNFLWRPGSATTGPSAVPVPLNPTWAPLTLSTGIVLPLNSRPMSSNGKIAGGLFKTTGSGGGFGGVAAVWSPDTNTTTSFSPTLPVLETEPESEFNFGWSIATAVNASGTALGWEWHHSYAPDFNLHENFGGTVNPNLSVSGSLLGADATPDNGPFYFPAAINDSGTAVAIRSINGPASAHLVVMDDSDTYDLGQVFNGNGNPGQAFQSLTNGVTLSGDAALAYTGDSSDPVTITEPVVFTRATPDYAAPYEMWWAHGWPSGTAGETQGWSEATPIELWDVSHTETISDRITPPTSIRANNRLEILLGDSRLVRNERIYDLNARLMPTGWRISSTVDINNSGVILAYATQINNPDGTPAQDQGPQPVLLVPLNSVAPISGGPGLLILAAISTTANNYIFDGPTSSGTGTLIKQLLQLGADIGEFGLDSLATVAQGAGAIAGGALVLVAFPTTAQAPPQEQQITADITLDMTQDTYPRILYHYTQAENVARIMSNGLFPADASKKRWGTFATDNPALSPESAKQLLALPDDNPPTWVIPIMVQPDDIIYGPMIALRIKDRTGGGTEYIFPFGVPKSHLLPAYPAGFPP